MHPAAHASSVHTPPLMKAESEKKTTAYKVCDEKGYFPNYCLVPTSKIVLA
jgi:hypothetical protein